MALRFARTTEPLGWRANIHIAAIPVDADPLQNSGKFGAERQKVTHRRVKPPWVAMRDQPADRRCGLVAMPQAADIAGCLVTKRSVSHRPR
jgi:hypothetical protein